MASTATGTVAIIDQARVDAVNSVSPYGANPFVLNQLGAQFGVPRGLSANASAFVIFNGSPGYVIPPGFTVSDGTHQFTVQDGGAVTTGGASQPLYVVSTATGSFAVPAAAVNQIVTSVPTGYTLYVTNPQAGIPASNVETEEAYRARVVDAYKVATPGEATYLKTLLRMVPGVSPRLVAVPQVGTMWEVICGGGDPYQTAAAIYSGVGQIGLLTGSATTIRNISVSIFDAPDTYQIVYVNPPQQNVTASVLWNTSLINFTAGAAVNQYIITATQAYINGITVGQPINLLVLQEQIQAAIASVLAPANLTTLQISISINGLPTPPSAGTSTVPSDPESFMYVSDTGVTSAQG